MKYCYPCASIHTCMIVGIWNKWVEIRNKMKLPLLFSRLTYPKPVLPGVMRGQLSGRDAVSPPMSPAPASASAWMVTKPTLSAVFVGGAVTMMALFASFV